MPRSRYKVCDPDAPHFFTCTVLNWIPIFTRPETAGILLEAFQHRQENHNWRLYGYVILENHCHFVAQAPKLDEQVARFKSYTARKIIDYLQEHRVTRILDQLRALKEASQGRERVSVLGGRESPADPFHRGCAQAEAGLHPQ